MVVPRDQFITWVEQHTGGQQRRMRLFGNGRNVISVSTLAKDFVVCVVSKEE